MPNKQNAEKSYRIQLPFDKAIKGLLKVKPTEKVRQAKKARVKKRKAKDNK